MRDFSFLSLFCVLMERGIFCSNRLALERNKALLLDVFVVTLELHGIFSHESWEWKARGRSQAAFGFPPLLKGHLLVCFSFYGAYQAGLAQIVRAAKWLPHRLLPLQEVWGAFPPCSILSPLYYSSTEFSHGLLTCRVPKCFWVVSIRNSPAKMGVLSPSAQHCILFWKLTRSSWRWMLIFIHTGAWAPMHSPLSNNKVLLLMAIHGCDDPSPRPALSMTMWHHVWSLPQLGLWTPKSPSCAELTQGWANTFFFSLKHQEGHLPSVSKQGDVMWAWAVNQRPGFKLGFVRTTPLGGCGQTPASCVSHSPP